MKLFSIALITSSIIALSSCTNEINSSESETTTEVKTEKVEVVANDAVDVKIEGMVCINGCKAVIEKKLNSTNGVANCDIDFENGTAHISFDNNQISPESILQEVEGVNNGAYSASFISEEAETEVPEEKAIENTEA